MCVFELFAIGAQVNLTNSKPGMCNGCGGPLNVVRLPVIYRGHHNTRFGLTHIFQVISPFICSCGARIVEIESPCGEAYTSDIFTRAVQTAARN